jgi:hypothetical protein
MVATHPAEQAPGCGQMMDALQALIGLEASLDVVNEALRLYAASFAAPVVGAMHITCADESEWECIEAFQRGFVDPLLPELKHAERAPFRLCNLGARYEEGAIAVAEHHYATPETRNAFKVLLVQVNAHVAVEGTGAEALFGQMQRYDAKSTACGALHALMAGADLPALRELRETFSTDGMDRLAALLDPHCVTPAHRGLFVALANARLQARRIEDAISRHEALSPTLYLVSSCVTLNRPEEDTELLCGLATMDRRSRDVPVQYVGLGDDPTAYRVSDRGSRLHVGE